MPLAMGTSNSISALVDTLKANTIKKIHTAFILLLSNYEPITSYREWASVYERPMELAEIKSFLISTTTSLADILALEPVERLDLLDRLSALKDVVAEMERSIQTYILSAQLLEKILSDLPLVIGVADIDEDYVINSCMDYVQGGSNASDTSARMSKIMDCFPVTMNRDALGSYLTRGYTDSLPEDSAVVIENILYLHKTSFRPRFAAEYGRYFAEIKYDLEKIQRDMLNDIQLSRTDYYRAALDNLYNEVSIIRDRLYIAYESINFLLILLDPSRDITDISQLSGNDYIAKDIFCALREKAGKPDDDFFDERLSELLADKSERAVDELQASNDEVNKILAGFTPRELKNLPGEAAEVYSSWRLVTDLLYENLIDSAFILRGSAQCKCKSAPPDFIRRKVEELVQHVQEVLEQEPPEIAALLKNFLIHSIPCPFSIDEFRAYVSKNLKDCTDKSVKANIAYKIFDIFIDAKFIAP